MSTFVFAVGASQFVGQMAARRRLSLRESAQQLFSAQHLTASKGLVQNFS